jgi:murein DD-endopeptidase MepM/ murein hydrolase activator NlpD
MKTILKLLVFVILALALAVGLVATFRVGAAPEIVIQPEMPAIGARTPVAVIASAPGRGLVDLKLELVQEGQASLVTEKSYRPLPPWGWLGERTERDEIRGDVGRELLPDLRQGEAILRVTAGRAGTWLRHPDPVVHEMRLPVRLVPPELSVLSTHNYVTQGGAAVVVYRAGDTSVRDGVQAGEWFFPGHPLPGGGPADRFCLFGVPWDLDDEAQVRLAAEDDVRNRAELAFVDRFFPKPPARDKIRLSDKFMARVVPEILRRTPGLADRGDLLENYLQVNRDLRQSNAAELVELSTGSTPDFLWSEPFLPFPNALVTSAFADQRTYLYEGRDVDQQTHLGYDLASVAQSPVPAANRGRVLLARYFGIYGNTVVLDHGYGLTTLYSHLSAIEVEEGQTVERGATLGRTGATGLAGGDHLHFTTMVGGMPVNPTQWWDARWIRDRVARKLGPALPFQVDSGN